MCMMIEITFTYREYYKLLSFTERIPLNFPESFCTGLYAVLDTLPPLLLTLQISLIEMHLNHITSHKSNSGL